MEVMTFAGLPAVMFVETPTPEQLERFRSYRAIGIAGVARAHPPSWMDAHLPSAFRALAALEAPVTHYKICSTLDSSPTVGSIGRAVDIGAPIFGETPGAADWQPLVVAAPAIGRYQAFGNLFAASGDGIYRLDRHPVMQRHPVTPMDEADVRLHVGKQTSRAIGLIDFVAMKRGEGLARFDAEIQRGRSLLALDIVDDETLRWAGDRKASNMRSSRTGAPKGGFRPRGRRAQRPINRRSLQSRVRSHRSPLRRSIGRKSTASITLALPPRQASTITAGRPRSTRQSSGRALCSRADGRRLSRRRADPMTKPSLDFEHSSQPRAAIPWTSMRESAEPWETFSGASLAKAA
jgi:hypothetical protein